jgi:hypothetical protein
MGAILVIVLYPLIAYAIGMTFVMIAVRAIGGSSAWGTALAAPFSGKPLIGMSWFRHWYALHYGMHFTLTPGCLWIWQCSMHQHT